MKLVLGNKYEKKFKLEKRIGDLYASSKSNVTFSDAGWA